MLSGGSPAKRFLHAMGALFVYVVRTLAIGRTDD